MVQISFDGNGSIANDSHDSGQVNLFYFIIRQVSIASVSVDRVIGRFGNEQCDKFVRSKGPLLYGVHMPCPLLKLPALHALQITKSVSAWVYLLNGSTRSVMKHSWGRLHAPGVFHYFELIFVFSELAPTISLEVGVALFTLPHSTLSVTRLNMLHNVTAMFLKIAISQRQ
jgi:hypothetical protein